MAQRSRTSLQYHSLDGAANGSPVAGQGGSTGERRLGRKSWRTMGIRLNTEMTLQNVRITDIRLGGGSFGALDVRVAEWCNTKVAAKTLLLPKGECPLSPGESSLDFARHSSPYVKRVLQECNLMGRLCHPNIAQLYGVHMDADGRPVVITELLSESLAQRFAFGARLTFRDVMDVGSQVLSALTYLHSLPHPVAHGSLCSSNVLMTATGTVKLTDTNLALAHLHSPCTPTAAAGGGGGSQPDSPSIPAGRADGAPRHSATALLYLPADASLLDSYETSVDCFSFVILLMAMCLHREPRVPSLGEPSLIGVSELVRRDSDLVELRVAAPLIEPLVAVCLDDGGSQHMHNGTRGHHHGGGVATSCPSAHELLQNINEIRQSEEYRRWPFTLGSPFMHGAQRQVELESGVRMLQQQVTAIAEAATATVAQQQERMAEQVKQISSVHSAQVTRLRRRLTEARERVQQAHVAEAQERRERRVSEVTRDRLAKQLESLRAGSASPRSMATTSRHGHSDLEGGDEESIDGIEVVSPLGTNGYRHGSFSGGYDEPERMPDISEPMAEVSVEVPHDGVKLVSVDEQVTVDDIIRSLCEANGFPDPDGFCLLMGDEDTGVMKRTPSKSQRGSFRGRKFDRLKKKSGGETEAPTPTPSHAVLNGDFTLDQQGVLPHAQLLLHMRRRSDTFIRGDECCVHDEMEENVENDFFKCKGAMAEGRLLCTAEEACNLLAFHAQALYGNQAKHSKEQLKSIAESMKEGVNGVSLKAKHIKRLVMQYGQLHGLSMVQAKLRFVQLCKGLPTYNTSIFHVKERTSKKDKGRHCILVVGPNKIYKLDAKTKEVLEAWLMRNVFRAVATGELLTIEAPDKATLILSCTGASEIANLITKHSKAARESGTSPPLVTVTSSTPKHSPLKQSLSNTIVSQSARSASPRIIQRLAIRRTESATVIRKVSPNNTLRHHHHEHHQSSQSLHRPRSQSTSSVTKPATAKAAASKFHTPPHDLDTDSSGECPIAMAAASLPHFKGSDHHLTSSDLNLAKCPVVADA